MISQVAFCLSQMLLADPEFHGPNISCIDQDVQDVYRRLLVGLMLTIVWLGLQDQVGCQWSSLMIAAASGQ